MNQQQEAPLYDALLRHANKYGADFHVPGHKRGKVFDEAGRALFKQVLQLDLTEIGDLDDLHQPTGVIMQAQKLAAEAFSVKQTAFLVGGSTVGNVALIMATCQPGDEIIIQRNSHKSLFSGCMLAGARPICLQPEFDHVAGIYTSVTLEKLQQCLQRYPKAKAVFLTSPNYYGSIQPIKQIADVCNDYGVPLFVDEAHGAHFSAHPDLPPSATTCGAVAVVQSTHKMLPAMTMGSMLHMNGTSDFRDKILHVLATLQSSSPSYPIMASLDLARRYYAVRARMDISQSLPHIQRLRDKLNQQTGWVALSFADPYKIILQRQGWSGYEVEAGLRAQGVMLELADMRNVLCLLPLAIGEQQCSTLLSAVHKWSMKEIKPTHNMVNVRSLHLPEISEPLPISEIVKQRGEWVPLKRAQGRLAKQMVLPYPPGIPAILPGETYTASLVEDLIKLQHAGARLQGIQGSPSNTSVEVVK